VTVLRTKLLERQRELGLRDGEIAALVGIPRTTYNAIKTGHIHRVSLRVARRIVATFPDLLPYVLMDDHDREPILAAPPPAAGPSPEPLVRRVIG
jgi:DNA-binding XRE family transcriptional regulator